MINWQSLIENFSYRALKKNFKIFDVFEEMGDKKEKEKKKSNRGAFWSLVLLLWQRDFKADEQNYQKVRF